MYLVISKDNCLFCSMAKELLEENNKEFVEVNLSQLDQKSDSYKAYRSLVLDLDRMSVPTILEMVGGFSELNAKLKEETDVSE